MDLLIDGARAVLGDQTPQALDDGVAGRAGLEALGVVQAQEPVGVPVVHEPLGDRAADAGARDVAAEDGVHEGGLADPRLAEDGEVEAPEGLERLVETLLEHPLDLRTTEVRSRPRSAAGHRVGRLDAHLATVRAGRGLDKHRGQRVTVDA